MNNITNNLILQEESSCMATAMNLYFNRELFENVEQFEVIQRALVGKYTRKYYGILQEEYMSYVKVDGRLYKWTIDYSPEKINCVYPPRLKTKDKKAIVSYRDLNKVGHAECIRFDEDQVIIVRNSRLKKMPFFDCSLDVLVELAKNPTNELMVRIFHYSEIRK